MIDMASQTENSSLLSRNEMYVIELIMNISRNEKKKFFRASVATFVFKNLKIYNVNVSLC